MNDSILPVLYFDVYLVDDKIYSPDKYNGILNRSRIERRVRESNSPYKHTCKVNIAKYVLASYAKIKWLDVFIRFETENPADKRDFHEYCLELFPSCSVYETRSDTARKYVDHLSTLLKHGNPWVFFCPNNDHPFVSPNSFSFSSLICIAEALELAYSQSVVTVAYSHYTESINISSKTKTLWGYYAGIFANKIFEDDICTVIKLNKYLSDSIQLYRLNELIKIFSETTNSSRVIRIEDTESYLRPNCNHILVIPKVEICRHFDGYYHCDIWGSFLNGPLPLFIPPGFFEKKIKIRYGYHDYQHDCVNINPASSSYSCFTENHSDLKCFLHEVPLSWKDRIIDININQDADCSKLAIGVLDAKKILFDPWQRPVELNILNAYCRYILSPLWLSYCNLRRILFNRFGKKSYYRKLCVIRDRILRK